MIRFAYRLASLVLVAMLLGALAPFITPKAYACSCGSPDDALKGADYVVVGRARSWDIVADPTSMPSFQTIKVTLDVDQVLIGDPQRRLTFFDSASYIETPIADISPWAGSSGSCGTFNDDPTGIRGLYSLYKDDDGRLVSSMCSGTVLASEERAADGLDRVIAQAEATLGVEALAVPDSEQSERFDMVVLVLALSASGVVMVGGFLLLLRRSLAK